MKTKIVKLASLFLVFACLSVVTKAQNVSQNQNNYVRNEHYWDELPKPMEEKIKNLAFSHKCQEALKILDNYKDTAFGVRFLTWCNFETGNYQVASGYAQLQLEDIFYYDLKYHVGLGSASIRDKQGYKVVRDKMYLKTIEVLMVGYFNNKSYMHAEIYAKYLIDNLFLADELDTSAATNGYNFLGLIQFFKGDKEGALATFKQGFQKLSVQKVDEEELLYIHKLAYNSAALYARLKNDAESLKWLDIALKQNARHWFQMSQNDPDFNELKNSPEYKNLVKRYNLQ